MLTGEFPSAQTPFAPMQNLAVGYMTNNQMGYLPQQQYLTPSEYGAFRTTPQNLYSTDVYQRPSVFQNYLYANNGAFMGMHLPVYSPQVHTMRRQGHALQGFTDDLVAGGATAFDTALGIAAFANPYTALASMVMPSPGAYMADVQGQMRKLQRMTSPKITMGSDVNRLTGSGFSSSKALGIEQFMRKSAAGSPFHKQEDFREILRHGVENNLFDYANDAEAYKKTLAALEKQTLFMAKLIDDKSVKGIMKNLKRIQDMGARGELFSTVARQEDLYSRMTGIRHSDMVDSYGQQGALIYAQKGLTAYQGSLSAMGNAAGMVMSQRLGLVDPGQLNRLGGVSGAAQNLTENVGNAQLKLMEIMLPAFANKDFNKIDEKSLNSFLSGGMNAQQAMLQAAENVKDPSKYSKYLINSKALQEDFFDALGGDMGMKAFITEFAAQFGKMLNPGGSRRDLIALGLKQGLGMDTDSANILADQFSSKEFIKGALQQQIRQTQEVNADELSKHKTEMFWSPLTKLKSGVHDTFGAPLIDLLSSITSASDKSAERKMGIFGNADYAGDLLGGSNTANRVIITRGGGGGTGGTGGTGEEVVSSPGSDRDRLKISAFAESRGGKGIRTFSDKPNDAGGKSYGTYQMASTMKTPNEFMKYIAKHGTDEQKAIAKKYENFDFTGSGGEKLWNELVDTGVITEENEVAFMTKAYWEPGLNTIKKYDPKLYEAVINGSTEFQGAILAATINKGTGATAHLAGVWSEGASEEEMAERMASNLIRLFAPNAENYKATHAYTLDAMKGARDKALEEKRKIYPSATDVTPEEITHYLTKAWEEGAEAREFEEHSRDQLTNALNTAEDIRLGKTDPTNFLVESSPFLQYIEGFHEDEHNNFREEYSLNVGLVNSINMSDSTLKSAAIATETGKGGGEIHGYLTGKTRGLKKGDWSTNKKKEITTQLINDFHADKTQEEKDKLLTSLLSDANYLKVLDNAFVKANPDENIREKALQRADALSREQILRTDEYLVKENKAIREDTMDLFMHDKASNADELLKLNSQTGGSAFILASIQRKARLRNEFSADKEVSGRLDSEIISLLTNNLGYNSKDSQKILDELKNAEGGDISKSETLANTEGYSKDKLIRIRDIAEKINNTNVPEGGLQAISSRAVQASIVSGDEKARRILLESSTGVSMSDFSSYDKVVDMLNDTSLPEQIRGMAKAVHQYMDTQGVATEGGKLSDLQTKIAVASSQDASLASASFGTENSLTGNSDTALSGEALRSQLNEATIGTAENTKKMADDLGVIREHLTGSKPQAVPDAKPKSDSPIEKAINSIFG